MREYAAGATVCEQGNVASFYGVLLLGNLLGWEQRPGSGVSNMLLRHGHYLSLTLVRLPHSKPFSACLFQQLNE